MKLELMTPRALVDINRLDLAGISDLADGGVRIGATVRNSDLAADRRIRTRYPVLSRALLAGASAQLRNKATTGGNLLQRTRCYYFYDAAYPCNKRVPGSGCGAIGGLNRIHAIVGASASCIATHPSDMAVAMRALDAVVETTDAHGATRAIPIAEFHRLPGETPEIETVLRPGEVIAAVRLPPPPAGRQAYRKVRDSRLLRLRAGLGRGRARPVGRTHPRGARIACGGLAHKPWRVEAAEHVMVGQAPGKPAFDAAADLLLRGARGYGHNDFKIALTRRTLHATLASLSAA